MTPHTVFHGGDKEKEENGRDRIKENGPKETGPHGFKMDGMQANSPVGNTDDDSDDDDGDDDNNHGDDNNDNNDSKVCHLEH